ncbi:MAG: endolytic transglycosylase MltG [Lachnospiraceae bacterium]|nr:endolytic transglycosylase MltG [Lachnospiraceae bacterium]
MSVKYVIGATAQIIIKVVVFAYLIMFIFRTAIAAYDYGYRVFTEPPLSYGDGRIISVYIEEDNSALDVGKMLQEKGLIRDGRLFMIQELLSEHHGNIQPGVYDLNTNMTVQEILTVIAQEPESDEETAE